MSANDKFYTHTISGVELKVKFAFSKMYFTKDIKDKHSQVYYDVGTLSVVQWGESAPSRIKTVLNNVKALDIPSGTVITQGSMGFKVFHRDSLEVLKAEILAGINAGADKPEAIVENDNPFLTLVEDEEIVFETTSDPREVDWVQMPFFDILLFSTASDEGDVERVKMMEIKKVKIYSEGFAESVESLEVNSLASFISLEGVGDWREIE